MQSASILPKNAGAASVKPGQNQGGKASFVICEICDGWIKDLDQLRNHMQWMHKVKVSVYTLISSIHFDLINNVLFIFLQKMLS